MAEIETTIVDFIQAHHRSLEHELPPAAGPRALLKAHLAELAETSARRRWQALRSALGARNLSCACALMVLAVLGMRILYEQTVSHKSSAVVHAEALPNPQLTPGATRAVAVHDLCSIQHDEVRPVPNSLRTKVLNEYGVPSARAADYEVDYLITPGLGGTDDIQNLWPQPHDDTAWNSYVKDQLEERLHHLVCGGQLDLATAQRQIASNWIVAYKKYFGADHPLAVHDRAVDFHIM